MATGLESNDYRGTGKVDATQWLQMSTSVLQCRDGAYKIVGEYLYLREPELEDVGHDCKCVCQRQTRYKAVRIGAIVY